VQSQISGIWNRTVLTASEALARPSLEKARVELDAARFRMCTKVQFKRLPFDLEPSHGFHRRRKWYRRRYRVRLSGRDEIEIGGIPDCIAAGR
jgi:hypothetical protein